MKHFTERPLNAPGLYSYRYRGSYSFVMIGAHNTADALREAQRSIDGTVDPSKLEQWDTTTKQYQPLTDTR